MAIQLPNPGLGDGQTGDNEYVMWTKVKDNFSNTTHAASRIVGRGSKDLIERSDLYASDIKSKRAGYPQDIISLAIPPETAEVVQNASSPAVGYGIGLLFKNRETAGRNQVSGLIHSRVDKKIYQLHASDSTKPEEFTVNEVMLIGHNAFADGNGFWKTSSPVVRVYANEFDPNDDAKKQGVTYTRNGVGNYTLHNTLGLAQTGWQIELPQDNNRNPLVAVETEYTKEGDLNIRTYRRIFSMETFTFTCDYDNPLDIPEGRCVDVRLHEVKEQLDEPIE